MELTVKKIAEIVQGTIVSGSEDRIITGARGLDDAREQDISFFSNKKYIRSLTRTQAGVVILRDDVPGETVHTPALILAEAPELAFARILQIIADEKKSYPPGIDSRAYINEHATVKPDVSIGPFVIIEQNAFISSGCIIGGGSYIGKNCHIGRRTLIHPRTSVLDESTIGERVIIHSGTVIGSDGYGFVTHKGKHIKIPQVGNVIIGDDVEIGANVTIDRGTTGSTRIGTGTKIDNLVHIAHNVQVGEHCLLLGQSGISGSTTVGNNVTLAGQAGIIGHVTIGDNVIIGGKAGVIGNVPAGSVVSGYFARPHRDAMKIQGYIQRLPEIFREFKRRKESTNKRS